MSIDNREPKWKVVKRLEAEGRIDKFREVQRQIKLDLYKRKKSAGEVVRDIKTESFYLAAERFPPLAGDA
jgi:hypothetical protein